MSRRSSRCKSKKRQTIEEKQMKMMEEEMERLEAIMESQEEGENKVGINGLQLATNNAYCEMDAANQKIIINCIEIENGPNGIVIIIRV